MGDFENKTDEWQGEVKETVGDATDNEDLQAEGAAEKVKARTKQTFEDAKDNLEDATDAAKDKIRSTLD
ncbi:MAG: CsbD family protein [Aeromicrobium sp.]